MTLLAKKQGMATSDFRSYWAGPHAKLALGMEGIAKYVHNRIDKLLWASADRSTFSVDGIVELYFSDEDSMRSAQASSVGRRYIPADEPNFLRGWTLCIVDTDGDETSGRATKVIVPFLLDANASRDRIAQALGRAATEAGAGYAVNWTVSTARREALWSEPHPPEGFAVFWFDSVASAHEAFDDNGPIRSVLEREVMDPMAFLIDELVIR